jgi:hypothetical protein
MPGERSSAEITLRLFVQARWVLLVLIALGWTLQLMSPGLFQLGGVVVPAAAGAEGDGGGGDLAGGRPTCGRCGCGCSVVSGRRRRSRGPTCCSTRWR